MRWLNHPACGICSNHGVTSGASHAPNLFPHPQLWFHLQGQLDFSTLSIISLSHSVAVPHIHPSPLLTYSPCLDQENSPTPTSQANPKRLWELVNPASPLYLSLSPQRKHSWTGCTKSKQSSFSISRNGQNNRKGNSIGKGSRWRLKEFLKKSWSINIRDCCSERC